jgi:hypothetical protein
MALEGFPNVYRVPGRNLFAGEYPGDKVERKTRAKLRALLSAGIDVFVDLTQADELVPYERELRDEAQSLGVRVACFRRARGSIGHCDLLRAGRGG